MPHSRILWRPVRRLAERMIGLIVAVSLAGGCGTDRGGSATGSPDGNLTVMAAASLAAPFTTLADELEHAQPGLTITLVFGPSRGIVEQVLAGAPADVLATADDTTMAAAVADGLVAGDPEVFARNSLALAVPRGNPGGVRSLADLGRPELRVALCEPRVPCGAVAAAVLDRAGVETAPDTWEHDARSVIGKVVLGEVDAALVFRTDAARTDEVDIVEVAGTGEVLTDYPVAVLAGAPNPAGADAFVQALTSASGRHILADAGFELP